MRVRDQRAGRKSSQSNASSSSSAQHSEPQQRQQGKSVMDELGDSDVAQPVAARAMSEAVAEKLRDVATSNLSEDAAGVSLLRLSRPVFL